MKHLPQHLPPAAAGRTSEQRRAAASPASRAARPSSGGWQMWSSAGPATTPRPIRGGDLQGMGDSTKWTAYQPVTLALVCTGVNLFMSD